ncbi:MAG: DUF3575 domain-containing protein [Rikenellaceae bacterium]
MKKLCYTFITLLLLTVMVSFNVNAQTRHSDIEKTIATVNFRFAKTVVDSGYMNNNVELRKLQDVFSNVSDDMVIDSVNILACGSPDGPYEINKKISLLRAEALRGYIVWKYPQMRDVKFILNIIPEDWDGLRNLIDADVNVPSQKKALEIIDSNISNDVKKDKLVALNNGETNKYMRAQQMYAKLRTGASCTVWYTKTDQGDDVVEQAKQIEAQETSEIASIITEDSSADEAKVITEQNTADEASVIAQTDKLKEASSLKEKKPVTMSIKTNVPLLAALVFNGAIEFGFGDRYSVDIPLILSPYTVSSSYKFKVVTIEPEFRFWLKNNTKGHFFGVHALFGKGSVVSPVFLNEDIDYKTTRPAFGFGVSYGYLFRLAKHWGLEATLGAGYVNIKHDKRPLNSSIIGATGVVKNYWGITRAQINLIYNFNLRK